MGISKEFYYFSPNYKYYMFCPLICNSLFSLPNEIYPF